MLSQSYHKCIWEYLDRYPDCKLDANKIIHYSYNIRKNKLMLELIKRSDIDKNILYKLCKYLPETDHIIKYIADNGIEVDSECLNIVCMKNISSWHSYSNSTEVNKKIEAMKFIMDLKLIR